MRWMLVLMIAGVATVARADDWPQWMGPRRDNIWRETGLLQKFPAGGPKVRWRVPVAGGYAGPAVVGNRVFVTDYVTKDNVNVDNFQRKSFSGIERVRALDVATGREVWRHEYPVKYTISYPAGPRCTPTVHAGKVYALGAEGHLNCLDAESGSVVWTVHLPAKYETKTALWGYASHPLVDGDKLLCVAGGDGSHIVALDLNSGKEIWRAQSAKEQGYSPPTIIEAGGKRQLVLLKPDGVASIDPDSGKEYWTAPYAASNGSIIMAPVRVREYLFVAGYNNKSLLLKLAADKPGAEVVWRDKRGLGMSPVNVQPFVEGNIVYGFDQDGTLRAIDMPEGKRLWQTPQPVGPKALYSGTAFLNRQGDRCWMFSETGHLVIAQITKDGFSEIDRAKLLEPTGNAFGRKVVWCPPAFAQRCMFVRNDKECVCVELSE